MWIGACQFSINLSGGLPSQEEGHFFHKIREKIFSRFKILLVKSDEKKQEGELRIGLAVVGNDSPVLRQRIDKVLLELEEEGFRVENEKIEVFEF